MLAAPTERGLKHGHVSKGAVKQGYTELCTNVDTDLVALYNMTPIDIRA